MNVVDYSLNMEKHANWQLNNVFTTSRLITLTQILWGGGLVLNGTAVTFSGKDLMVPFSTYDE
jgi:hypothetical protein